MKPLRGNILFLAELLQKDKTLQKHFDMNETFSRLMQIQTYNLYRYILYLYINKKRFKLNTILTRLGFKARKI